MKRKWQRICTGLALHLIISFVLLGAVRVYQQGYNRTHREQLQLASVTVEGSHAEVQVLERSYALSLRWLAEDSPLYYAAYCLTGEALHSWVFLLTEFMK